MPIKRFAANIRLTLLAIAMASMCMVSGFVRAADDHADHDSGSSGHSGGGGKGKGPKYMGGQKGESHSHEGHSGGSSSHKGGTSRGGSKHTEDKIFDGHEDHDEGGATGHGDELTPEI